MTGARRRKKNNNRTGKVCISMIVVAFVAVISVQIYKTYQKDLEYQEQQQALEQQLEYEQARQADLQEYEKYTQSQEYIEDIAKSKLGLAYENEIIFKEEKQ